jgi:phosphate transport system substrate-binding protein
MRQQGTRNFSGLLAVCALLVAAGDVHGQGIDPNLPPYHPEDGLTGTVTLIGSATMSNLADVWRESFLQYHPKVKINIVVRGSVNAVPAVMDGSATFGLLSRAITAEEVDAFQNTFSYPPKILTPSQEMLAIYVHKENPIQGLTLEQVGEIFSANSKIRTWGDLGVKGAWASQSLDVQGRADTTGSTQFLQNLILRGQDFTSAMQENKSNMQLIDAIGNSRTAIGYAGVIYQTPNVRAVPLAAVAGQDYVDIQDAGATLNRYPLMRPLQLVINQAPGKELPAVQKEFLRYVFSRLGQEDVVKGGFQPVPGPSARFALDQVGLRELN